MHFPENHGRKTEDGGKWFRRRAICTAVSVSCGTSEKGIRLPEAGAHGKGALRVLSPVYRTLQAEKEETYRSWLRQKEQGFAVCKKQGLLKKDEEETNARVLKKLKKLEETAKKCRKTDSDQMKELFETVCELEQEKAEKEVKDVKLQIRRAAEFLQNSFPGGAEVVLFEANLARSPALRSFLIEKSMDAE